MFRAYVFIIRRSKFALHNLWYHHTYGCDETRGCVMQFWPPDDEHMCSKHVEAWNKLIVKQKFCASNWLIAEINILRCKVSKTSIHYTLLTGKELLFLWQFRNLVSAKRTFRNSQLRRRYLLQGTVSLCRWKYRRAKNRFWQKAKRCYKDKYLNIPHCEYSQKTTMSYITALSTSKLTPIEFLVTDFSLELLGIPPSQVQIVVRVTAIL